MDERPFYTESLSEARRKGQVVFYTFSHEANIDCKQAIEKAIKENFDSKHLNADTAKSVIAEFGYDRVGYVLANTIQHKDWSKRFSMDNKLWANETFIPKEDWRRDYVVESKPAVLNIFVNQFKQAYKELNLWDKSQMIDPKNMDFEGKVMVIRPEELNEAHKTRDKQLFYCIGGLGCKPDKTGENIMGEFLIDGTHSNSYRQYFLGQAKPELLPAWAKEKLLQKEQQKPSVKKQLEQAKTENPTKPKTAAKNKDKEVR